MAEVLNQDLQKKFVKAVAAGLSKKDVVDMLGITYHDYTYYYEKLFSEINEATIKMRDSAAMIPKLPINKMRLREIFKNLQELIEYRKVAKPEEVEPVNDEITNLTILYSDSNALDETINVPPRLSFLPKEREE